MVASSYFQTRVYVGQRGIPNYSWGVDDMTDIYAYFDSGLGRPATIRSPTFYWSGSLKLSRPGDLLFDHTIETSVLTKNVITKLPLQTTDLDYFVLADTLQTLKNKRITPNDNDLAGIEKFPDHAKSGKYQGSNFQGEGLMEGLMHRNLPELKGDSTHGSYAQYTTPSTAEGNDGHWIPNSYLTLTKFDPVIKLKFRIPNFAVNTNRFFYGFVTADTILKNDTPFGNADAAALVGFRNGDSDFKIFRGVGDGQTLVNPYSTNVNVDQDVFEIELGFRNEGTELYYIFDNGTEIKLTTQLPQTNRWIKLHCDIQNTTANSRHLDCFYSRMESKK